MPLPHGLKAVVIAVSSFLLLMAIMVGPLQLATSPRMVYTNLESKAAYEKGLFGLLTFPLSDRRDADLIVSSGMRAEQTPTDQSSIIVRLSFLEERLENVLTEDPLIRVPVVHLTPDF